jgi:predicted transcriptional regulator of viral defense system
VRVAFYVRKKFSDVPLQEFNTPRGTIQVSGPEVTALDLVGYQGRVGGLDQVATVLSELAEQIDPKKLVVASRSAPIAWVQRLGYLLEQTGAGDKVAAVKMYVAKAARLSVALLPGSPAEEARREPAWKLAINTDVEIET